MAKDTYTGGHTLFLSAPPMYQGAGSAKVLLEYIVEQHATQQVQQGAGFLLLIISRSVLTSSYYTKQLQPLLQNTSVAGTKNSLVSVIPVVGEPSAELVDSIAKEHAHGVAVIGIGGGSVLDTAKAVSAAITMKHPIEEYLEGVGSRKPTGTRVKLYLIPTTAGTGSEATTNGVLSKVGKGGYKKSLRHPNYLSDRVALDPLLLQHAPSKVIAASGMDALTQLLEAYVSSAATPASLGVARAGLLAIKDSLEPCFDGTGTIEDHMNLLYAANCSGVALANAGLGVVHGVASAVGGVATIPHGVLCGTMIPHATKLICQRAKEFLTAEMEHALKASADTVNAHAFEASAGSASAHTSEISVIHHAIQNMYQRYAEAGVLLGAPSLEEGVTYLIEWLFAKKHHFALPKLREFHISLETLMQVTPHTSNKNCPLQLEEEDIALLYEECW